MKSESFAWRYLEGRTASGYDRTITCDRACLFRRTRWLAASGRAWERDAARRELRLSQVRGSLAWVAIDARRGDYEPARQAASEFFTSLRKQAAAAGGDSDLTPAQRDSLRPLLDQRGDLITLLARSDPASADRLSDLYVSYRKALGDAQAPGGI